MTHIKNEIPTGGTLTSPTGLSKQFEIAFVKAKPRRGITTQFLGETFGTSDAERARAKQRFFQQKLTPQAFEEFQTGQRRGQVPILRRQFEELQAREARGEFKAGPGQRQAARTFELQKARNVIAQRARLLGIEEEVTAGTALAGFQPFREEAAAQALGRQFKRGKIERRVTRGVTTRERADREIAAIEAEGAFQEAESPEERERLRQISRQATQARIGAGDISLTPREGIGERRDVTATRLLETEGPTTPELDERLSTIPMRDQELLRRQLFGGNPDARAFALQRLGLSEEQVPPSPTIAPQPTQPGQVVPSIAGVVGAPPDAVPTPDVEPRVGDVRGAVEGFATGTQESLISAITSDIDTGRSDTNQVLDALTNQSNAGLQNFISVRTSGLRDFVASAEERALNLVNAYNSATATLTSNTDAINEASEIQRRALEEGRIAELGAVELGRDISARELERSRVETEEAFERTFTAQEQSVRDERVRNETFLGLRGGFGSSAGLENITRAEQQGQQVLRDLTTRFGREQLEFSARAQDINSKYVNDLRSINATKDAKLGQILDGKNQQIQRILRDVSKNETEKAREVNKILDDLNSERSSVVKSVADAMWKANADVMDAGLALFKEAGDRSLAETKLTISRAKAVRAGEPGAVPGVRLSANENREVSAFVQSMIDRVDSGEDPSTILSKVPAKLKSAVNLNFQQLQAAATTPIEREQVDVALFRTALQAAKDQINSGDSSSLEVLDNLRAANDPTANAVALSLATGGGDVLDPGFFRRLPGGIGRGFRQIAGALGGLFR